MILFARAWRGSCWADAERAAASLGVFAGHKPDTERCGSDLFAELSSPRARPKPGWRVARSRLGWPALLSGWIDNRNQLARELGVPADCPAGLFAQAVERWGDDADRHVIGCYAALVCLPDNRVRLSRSPWGGKSLHYYNDGDALLVASIPRPLFAAGIPKRLRRDAIDQLVGMELPSDEQAMFEGVNVVPHGASVVLQPDRGTINRWYDPLALAPVKLRSDHDYAEAADSLLAEAVSAALQSVTRPGITLSGGLDSPLVCSEVLRQLPSGQRLPSFTFHPLPEWDGFVASHKFGDDRPFVEQFAAMHPNLEPHFCDNRGIAFDDRAGSIFAACDAGYPARVAASVHHGPYKAAADAGCDWLLTADCGNLTFSNGAPWAAAEFLRRGQLRQLWLLARSNIADPRSIARRMFAMAVMPSLPLAIQAVLRKIVHGSSDGANRYANPFLRADSRVAHLRRQSAIAANIMTVDRNESRAAYVRANYHAMGLGGEIPHGYEQVFGIRLRDVTAYRPLIEFCFSVPTGQFVRDGEQRWLARRMAIGRLPEAQRVNRLYGEHNSDWHARLTPRVNELRGQVSALAEHPELEMLLDVPAMLAALDRWPERTPEDLGEIDRLRFYLPSMLYIARFIDHTTGRNPQ